MLLSSPSNPIPTELAAIEQRMRSLLPASLYAALWVEPTADTLMQVFQHLRTMQQVLHDYMPRQVSEAPPSPGDLRYGWQEGTLLFTDLAGFTPLLEVNADAGPEGAAALLTLINRYFSSMIEIISKSGGDLLEFTGDAMLVQFVPGRDGSDAAQAVRAGLRMQRAMAQFMALEMPQGQFSLDMRVGIHTGRFLAADIGTPERMVRVLLGKTVQQAKLAETASQVNRVCVSREVGDRLANEFQLQPLDPQHSLVIDNLSSEELGEYDISLPRRRMAAAMLMDRSISGLTAEIQKSISLVEPMASYLPTPILNLLVECAAQRQIPPAFPTPTVVFINLMGLPEAVDTASPDEVELLVRRFSQAFALIHASVRSRGGVLQKVTYHSLGSDMLIYFGALGSHPADALRAADMAIAVRQIVSQLSPPLSAGQPVPIGCRVGIDQGAVFAAEIGSPRARREFNILGDPVNTAARLMTVATSGQILLTEAVYQAIAPHYTCTLLGDLALKGKATPIAAFELQDET
ncbi:MAG: hypothetical protein Fur0046_10680 [Cyanobacteria bacterium J069]|nr:MAG: adenylate/guanylate cyclase domain-containing protein [Cyanobacteria bacterium J069]